MESSTQKRSSSPPSTGQRLIINTTLVALKKKTKQNKTKESKTKWKEREEANKIFQTYQPSFCFNLILWVNNELSEGNREIKSKVSKGKGRMTRKIKWKVKGGYLSVGANRLSRSAFNALCGSTRLDASPEQLSVSGRV